MRFRVWDIRTGKPLGEPVQAPQGTVWSVAFSPDGTQFATVGSSDRTIRLWKVATQRQHRELKNEGDTGAVWHVAYYPDGKSLAAAGNYDEIQFWEVATGKLRSKIAGPQVREKLQRGVYALRVVLATHRDLHAMVAERKFREDLWYRIAVFPIRLPPLRDRKEDIPSLAAHFALRAAKRLGTRPLTPRPEDIAALISYPWPGNLRELSAVMERAAILGEGKTLEVARALGVAYASPGVPQGAPIEERQANPSPGAYQPATYGVEPKLVPEFATLNDAMVRQIEQALVRTHGRIEGPHGAARPSF